MYFSAQSAEGRKKYAFFTASPQTRYLIRQLMRISSIIAIVFITSLPCLFATEVIAQSTQQVQVTIEMNQEPITSAIKKIEQNSQFRFLYRNNELKNLKPVSIPLGARTVKETLDLILNGTGLTYNQLGDKILISKLPVANTITSVNDTRLTGMVTDEEGIPLPGVSIRIKGDKEFSTASDQYGHYSVNIPAGKTITIIFSYVGYVTKEISVDEKTNSLKTALIPEAGSLNEV